MSIEEYRSLLARVVAAAELRRGQKSVRPGSLVDYVYVGSEQVNPMKRTAPAESAASYDTEKCGEMLLNVTKSVLRVFGFLRTQLGFQHKHGSFSEKTRRGFIVLLGSISRQ